ncbi:MAG: TerC family protein [Candidatus Marinimicrobia bacterium]|jgi:predicted tellurium resistance membrane protein TerC|nr:TerC family protein [Candidatus Neomarinimicrobiota bacterium]MBT4359940.1 TerC family protein [Candidatus Neomarinimicrobiota bacterium]MBT4715849.1 TerC family protein [Candidatus Neomarinimicrobiota bacterium]MBT4947810.1 TerC family protein [Candidatus Neomarinimicrobiota bacterium]MBT5271297.1 TerC family protein [Candidatus Neomarinimicrobiota bacterium]
MIDHIATFALILGLELVLGIDNILVISIMVGRIEEARRERARYLGLLFALVLRIAILALLLAITGIKQSIVFGLSVRDLIMLAGGMFLLWKAIKEIHHTVEIIEDGEHSISAGSANFAKAIRDIVLLDIVFSLDSVITAIGLTREIWVIIPAVIVSFLAILAFAKPIGEFILARPSLKILALSFLVTIGVTLFIEGLHQHVPRTLIYLPMGFAIVVEMLQMRFEQNRKNKALKASEVS